jgi:osmotically-inducible protein OsmY
VTQRERAADGGEIEIAVSDGIVTLEGHVPSLSHKRLAGVLAWWAPGCRDVTNELAIVPGEDDNDDEITDALALVLEKDPLVHAGQLRVRTRNRIVTLHGWLATEEERRMAELDAWYLFGVDEVINRIEVRH